MSTFFGTIYTVIPFFSNGIDLKTYYMKSFTDYDEAFMYASNNLNSGSFEIIENPLNQ